MEKCPNCGANMNGYCCEYCGTRIEPPKKKGLIENICDVVYENVNKALDKHRDFKKKREDEKDRNGK